MPNYLAIGAIALGLTITYAFFVALLYSSYKNWRQRRREVNSKWGTLEEWSSDSSRISA